jgi:hypothetical protein
MSITRVTSRVLADNSVGTAQLSAGAVGTAQLSAEAVTFEKLAQSSKILASNTLNSTTQEFTDTTFSISQPGWLIVSGNCVANYNGTISNAGNYAFIYLNNNLIAHDGMFEGESGSIGFYTNAVGMSILTPGTHTLRLEHFKVPAGTVRTSSRLSYVVFPI